ncbi:putrescine transport system ATP-binding protein [Pseudoxanthobacter soli DSM 19599]|uniref:Spermidine/putrescine import ATP-binding protein PotA n=1 Tax=Pseudoxanthobacter soli DSM 19599 TaxID=1123029 RepID=A0A1M7Z7D7_9HYPH|nr:ABC transporter ATP-binding protein [Pseudoxanthobacter soli]SHO60764.1 putrescine transport system ATP-binding protein [Pseudoxanthobacter soli DSM 19599]
MVKQAIGTVRRKFAPWDDPTQKPFIEFRNVTKRFGDFVAVEHLNLKIYEREFFALLGPSGCGKTTLMRMLAGFEDPTEGDVFLDGKPLKGVPPYRRPANMMFQSYALFPHMTVEQNIAFGLKQDGMPKPEIEKRVEEVLTLVKLTQFAKRKPHQLSGGQRQRVALARSVAKRPKVLLLDEPLGALDKKLREETQFELIDLQMELGMTFLIVTHDQEEAMTVADRIAVMNKGEIIQIAPPALIYEQPATRYVAEFIGDVNIFAGSLVSCDGQNTRIAVSDPELTIDAGAPTEAVTGSEVAFAVRPEKVRISLDPPADPSINALQGEVWDIGYLGDQSSYHVRLSNGRNVRATIVNSRRMVERPITWEDHVWLSWDHDAGVVLTR